MAMPTLVTSSDDFEGLYAMQRKRSEAPSTDIKLDNLLQPARQNIGVPSHGNRSVSSNTERDEVSSDPASDFDSNHDHSDSSDDDTVPDNDEFSDRAGSRSKFQELQAPAQPAYFIPDHPMMTLEDELSAALIPTRYERREFFAKDQLRLILTQERVQQELTTHFKDSLAEDTIARHARTICQRPTMQTKSYIKILAILIMVGKTNDVVKLLEDPEGVSDSDLPLNRVARPGSPRVFDLRIKTKSQKVLDFQTDWDQFNIRNFDELQWWTLPLEFSKPSGHSKIQHHNLDKQQVLPFVSDSRQSTPHFSSMAELEGGYSTVFKIAIHPKHHSFHTAPDNSDTVFNFAVKALHSKNKDAFDREVEMLRKFGNNRHPHLISLLATYEQVGRFFLLFDWAEADLQKYWRKINPSPSFDEKTVLWLARQCKGIAQGITKIHAHKSTYRKPNTQQEGSVDDNVIFGHHGDIKPENVLWFTEPGRENSKVAGTLKLSDFGLAEFSIHHTYSMPAPKRILGVTLGYRAPETDLNRKAGIGRSYDIWTLGCLYLEFVTWMLGGSKLLDKFIQERKAPDAMMHDIKTTTFFQLMIEDGKKKAVIKPTVTRFIRRLHAHQNCSQFLHDFLDMVEHNMLVVQTDDKQELGRFNIQQIYQMFVRMLDSCETDRQYAVQPVPWSLPM